MNELQVNDMNSITITNGYDIESVKTIEECNRILEVEYKKKEEFENRGITLIEEDIVEAIDSREVAEMMGKTHSALMKDINGSKDGKSIGIAQVLLKSNFDLSEYFIESSYKDKSGKPNNCYLITKKGCELLGNKQQGEKGILFSARYVEKFNEMEKKLKQRNTPSCMIQNPRERVRAWERELDQKEYTECCLKIQALEEKKRKLIIIDDKLTFDQFNRVANAMVNEISKISCKSQFEVWSDIYKFLERKYGWRLNQRRQNEMEKLDEERIFSGKKPYALSTLKQKVSKLSCIRENEYKDVISTIKAYAIEQNVSIIKLEEILRLK